MRHREWALYAVALTIISIGLLAFGVPASTLVYAALIFVCPLMTILMRGARHDHYGATTAPMAAANTSPPLSGDLVRRSS
jgi:hypothetical protein